MNPGQVRLPERLVRYCGADCSCCETYQRALDGDLRGVVNPETGYRCCWLPADHLEGRDCPIRACCDEKRILYCGECAGLDECERMRAFYAQPGYEALRMRMLEHSAGREGRAPR